MSIAASFRSAPTPLAPDQFSRLSLTRQRRAPHRLVRQGFVLAWPLLIWPAFLWFLLTAPLAAADEGIRVYRSEAAFEDVLQGLEAAIQEGGMYINNRMNLGEMLERTGKDLGREEPIYRAAESFEFCSSLLSRDMTLENPARIVNCPFIVSVYQLAGQPEVTYVAHREIPAAAQAASPVMARIAAMLEAVATAAIAW